MGARAECGVQLCDDVPGMNMGQQQRIMKLYSKLFFPTLIQEAPQGHWWTAVL